MTPESVFNTAMTRELYHGTARLVLLFSNWSCIFADLRRYDHHCTVSRVISVASQHLTTVIVYDDSYKHSEVMSTTMKAVDKHMVLYDYHAFPGFLREYMQRLLEHGTLEDFRSHLNFICICGRTCVQTSFATVLEMDDAIGQGSLLRHFSSWLIVSPEATPRLNITLDNVALLLTDFKESHLVQFNSYQNLKLAKNVADLFGEVFTLLWTTAGREWSRVYSCDQSEYDLYLSLFPNTQRGLNGRKIIFSTLEWLPDVKREGVNGKVRYVGSGMDVMKMLALKFNFSYLVVEPKDKQWGVELSNGSWTGVIGMLERQEAEMCPCLYGISQHRQKVVDFSTPVEAITFAAVYRRDTKEMISWLYLLSCFSWLVYLCVFASFLWMGVLFVCLYKHTESQNGLLASSVENLINVSLRQDISNLPQEFSSRIAVFTWCMFCLVVAAVYTGNLVAVATVDKYKPPFTTLQELAEQNEYGIGVYEGTYAKDLIMNSNCSVCGSLYPKLFKSTTEGKYPSDEMLRRKLMEEKFVLLVSENSEGLIRSTTCDAFSMKERFFPVHTGFIYKKHSPLRALLDDQIAILRDNGIIRTLWATWSPKELQCVSQGKDLHFKLSNFMTAVVACGAGVLVSFSVLLAERKFAA